MTTLMRVRPSAGGNHTFHEFRRAYCNAQRRARYASKRGLRERPARSTRYTDGPFGPDCVRYLHVVRQLGGRRSHTLHGSYLRVHTFRRMTGVPGYVRPVSVTLLKLANAAGYAYNPQP